MPLYCGASLETQVQVVSFKYIGILSIFKSNELIYVFILQYHKMKISYNFKKLHS